MLTTLSHTTLCILPHHYQQIHIIQHSSSNIHFNHHVTQYTPFIQCLCNSTLLSFQDSFCLPPESRCNELYINGYWLHYWWQFLLNHWHCVNIYVKYTYNIILDFTNICILTLDSNDHTQDPWSKKNMIHVCVTCTFITQRLFFP